MKKTEIYHLYKEHIKKPTEEMEEWEKVLKDMHDYEVKKRKKKINYYKEKYKHSNIDEILIDINTLDYKKYK
jgi:hypothetical protein